jgi:hypothetical protein
MLIQSFLKINHNFNLNRKNRRCQFCQKMIKTKNDNIRVKSCMIKKIVNTLLNLLNHQIENVINKKNKKCDLEITIIFLCISKNY